MLSLDEQLRVTQQTLKAREDAFNLAKRQFETGYTSRLELMQADSELRSTCLLVEGSSLQFLYQQSQKLFADSAVEAECPVPERYLTADAEL